MLALTRELLPHWLFWAGLYLTLYSAINWWLEKGRHRNRYTRRHRQ